MLPAPQHLGPKSAPGMSFQLAGAVSWLVKAESFQKGTGALEIWRSARYLAAARAVLLESVAFNTTPRKIS